MCGIGGFFSNNATPDPRLNMAITILGVLMDNRGGHSWGWTDGESVVKAVGEFQDGFNPSMHNVQSAIVHTRYGTTGDVKNKDNAHPFLIKGILGVHNGMIYNHEEMAKKHGIEYKVDSELIFHYIADGLPMTELRGYGTIVFYRDGKIHFGRFSTGGDFTIAKTEAGWLWASTEAALDSATVLSGIGVESYIQPELGKLYRIDGDTLVETEQSLVLDSYKPTTGKTSWQDFRKDEDAYYAGGWSNASYYSYSKNQWGKWADNKSTGIWEFVADAVQAAPPADAKITAETTTFTAEPTSDNDEVIDVSDADLAASMERDPDYYAADTRAEMRRKGIIDDWDDDLSIIDDGDDADINGENFYDHKNFYLSTAEEQFHRGWGQCADCTLLLSDDDDVYVQKWTEEIICESCYVNNATFATEGEPADDGDLELEAGMEMAGDAFAASVNVIGEYIPM